MPRHRLPETAVLALPGRPALRHAQHGVFPQRFDEARVESVHQGEFRPGKDGARPRAVVEQRGHLVRREQSGGQQAAPPGQVQVDGMRRQGLETLDLIFGKFLDAGRAGEGQKGFFGPRRP